MVATLLPLAIGSLLGNLLQPESKQVFHVTPLDARQAGIYSQLQVSLLGLDEWSGLATLQVVGTYICSVPCDRDARLLFVSIPTDDPSARGLPPSASIVYPPDGMETTQKIELPVSGDSLRYPFDQYRLRLGVIMERLFPDKSIQVLSPEDAKGHIFLTLRAHIPSTNVRQPKAIDPGSVRPVGTNYQYVYVEDLTIERPLYLQVLTVLLVALVSAAAAYAVFMRPLDQLVLNAGGLVLGIWGIRAILLGTAVSGVTAVDLSLSVVILFLLAAITARALQSLARLNQIRLKRPSQSGDAQAKEEQSTRA